ncbi:MAG TPA: redoxin domain-containing protein [Anaerolineaceae bacterium]|jgi:peroxiredoxin (alkyl hydroperoxide reductase subunit C)
MDKPKVEEQIEKPLPAGTKAPEFTLKSTPDKTVSLQDYRGKPVILAFYPADWSGTCGAELSLFNQVLPEFQKYGAEILGISVDGVHSHKAFMESKNLKFPLLADYHPKGQIGQAYGVYRANEGREGRALFVIDGNGVIRWSYVSPIGVNPGADGILKALDEISASEKQNA